MAAAGSCPSPWSALALSSSAAIQSRKSGTSHTLSEVGLSWTASLQSGRASALPGSGGTGWMLMCPLPTYPHIPCLQWKISTRGWYRPRKQSTSSESLEPTSRKVHALFLPRGIVKIQLVLPLKKSGFSSSLPLVCLLFIYILEHGFFNMVISLSKSMMS